MGAPRAPVARSTPHLYRTLNSPWRSRARTTRARGSRNVARPQSGFPRALSDSRCPMCGSITATEQSGHVRESTSVALRPALPFPTMMKSNSSPESTRMGGFASLPSAGNAIPDLFGDADCRLMAEHLTGACVSLPSSKEMALMETTHSFF
jgi:hypothetical protein